MTARDGRLDALLQLLDRVRRAGRDGDDGAAAGVVLDAYVRAVTDLRALVRAARERLARAESAVAEAKEFTRRRRRKAVKIAARSHTR